MTVVVTAGHVDHGKSTLVRALTGQEPDRLLEERRRGLSIRLGYCWTDLPQVGPVAFVDVPGHERFITTALSGMGPVPVALLVVAADDPWMPQAGEHLAALAGLGVAHGVLVVTRADLAPPEAALDRARAELAATSLRDVPDVCVSATRGEGLDELRSTLRSVIAALPPVDPGADVRLWVDRRFHVPGAGTVVTGTLPAGTVRVGDELSWQGTDLRVRGLESLGQARTSVSGVARVAVNLAGRVPAHLRPGSALVGPGTHLDCVTVDVHVPGAGTDPLPSEPLLHVGSAAVSVRVRPLGGDVLRLRLRQSLPLRIGDRGLLRDPGTRRVWGTEVYAVEPPELRGRGSASRRADQLGSLDGTPDAHLALLGLARRAELRRRGVPGPFAADTVVVGDWVLSPERAATLRDRLRDLLEQRDGAELTAVEACRALGVPAPEVLAALVVAPVHLDRGRLHLDADRRLPTRAADVLERLQAELRDRPFAAPDAARQQDLGIDAESVQVLVREGLALRLEGSVVLLSETPDLAVDLLRDLPQPFTPSQARQAWDTSRRVALPLLRHLDRTGRTLRLPDDRRRVRPHPPRSS